MNPTIRTAALVLVLFALGCAQEGDVFPAVHIFTGTRAGSNGTGIPLVVYAFNADGARANGTVKVTGTAGELDGGRLTEGVSVPLADGIGNATFRCDQGTDAACQGVVALEATFEGAFSQAFIRIEEPRFADRKPGMYPDAEGVGIVLRTLRWEFPCLVHTNDVACTTRPFEEDMLVMPGGKGVLYEVTFSIKGVVETQLYQEGTPRGVFYVGGYPAHNSGGNVYAISVSEPATNYFMNHAAYRNCATLLDYEATIVVAGGAEVTLMANSVDNLQLANRGCENGGTPLVPAGVPPAPSAYDGEFVQADVVHVRLVPCSEQRGPSCL